MADPYCNVIPFHRPDEKPAEPESGIKLVALNRTEASRSFLGSIEHLTAHLGLSEDLFAPWPTRGTHGDEILTKYIRGGLYEVLIAHGHPRYDAAVRLHKSLIKPDSGFGHLNYLMGLMGVWRSASIDHVGLEAALFSLVKELVFDKVVEFVLEPRQ